MKFCFPVHVYRPVPTCVTQLARSPMSHKISVQPTDDRSPFFMRVTEWHTKQRMCKADRAQRRRAKPCVCKENPVRWHLCRLTQPLPEAKGRLSGRGRIFSLSYVETQVASHDVAEICHDRGSCLSPPRPTELQADRGERIGSRGFSD